MTVRLPPSRRAPANRALPKIALSNKRALKIEYLPIGRLLPFENNSRRHPKKQIDKLARAIREFGFLIPILVDDRNSIIAGHARLDAAKLLGLSEIPCIRAGYLTEAQKRTFTIVDNRLAEDAAWDFKLLAKELVFLKVKGIELESTGFEIPQIEVILDTAEPAAPAAEDDALPAIAPDHAVTKPGDLWVLGDHRLYCGDACLDASFAALMPGEVASLIFTDPPFDVKIRGHVSGKGRVKHREFLEASGEKTSLSFGLQY